MNNSGQLVPTGTFTTSGVSQTPARLAGVPASLAGAEMMMASLAATLGELAARLEKAGVLTAGAPRAASADVSQPMYSTSLANAIDRLRSQAAGLSAAVNELQERIDL